MNNHDRIRVFALDDSYVGRIDSEGDTIAAISPVAKDGKRAITFLGAGKDPMYSDSYTTVIFDIDSYPDDTIDLRPLPPEILALRDARAVLDEWDASPHLDPVPLVVALRALVAAVEGTGR